MKRHLTTRQRKARNRYFESLKRRGLWPKPAEPATLAINIPLTAEQHQKLRELAAEANQMVQVLQSRLADRRSARTGDDKMERAPPERHPRENGQR